MSLPSNTEFAQYRFVRDAKGNVVNLPAQGTDEKILLVLDCERWGLARLHIFEGAALRADKLTAFEAEMGILAGVRSECVTRLHTWGRDGEELFFADAMRDGEPLPVYLGRAGKVPFATASRWILGFLDLIMGMESLPTSMDRLTTLNFEVVRDRSGSVRLVFSEFHGWTKPGAQVREHRLEWSLAQVFCSLIAGVPVRTFHRDSLPRNFDELPEKIRETILAALAEDGSLAPTAFREALQSGVQSEETGETPLPNMPLREWFRRELEESCGGDADRTLPLTVGADEEPYAILTRVRGTATNLQLLPGPASLPREGWLNQHHDATRRPGRGMLRQLQVNYLEDLGGVTLVGEERVEGVDLAALLEATGPLDLDTAKSIVRRLGDAVESLERQTGACAVWWLPPENILLLTGTRSLSASAALIGRKETGGWEDLPLKLRLHQTLATLLDGIDLPGKVRDCSRLPGRQFEAARRSTVGLPLAWHLLTGERFNWSERSEHSRVPASLGALFDSFRTRLRDEPEEVTECFFRSFASCPTDHGVEAAPDEPKAREMATGGDSIAHDLDRALFAGNLDLPQAGIAVLDRSEDPSLPEPIQNGSSEGPTRSSALPFWVWTIVAAILAASVVGYCLSGWSFNLGPFRSSQGIEFALPEGPSGPPETREDAGVALSEFLLAEGSPQSLRLLPLLEHLDSETKGREIEPWLRHLAAKGDVDASRVMGLLSLAFGEPTEIVLGWFVEAARKGDAESCYRHAVLRWNSGEGGFSDTESAGFLERAVAAGHAGACELQARVLLAKEDPRAAFESMDRAARQGWISAIYQSGILLAEGIGVAADEQEAAARFRKAAELGESGAMYEYGRCLSEGFGVSPSFPESLRWMKLASSRGHGPALRWLLDRGIDPAAPGE